MVIEQHGSAQRRHQVKIEGIESEINKKQQYLESKEEEVVLLRAQNKELKEENILLLEDQQLREQ
jgi:hypothetical protein